VKPTEVYAAEAARRVRDMVARDPHAPRYHFVAPEARTAMPFDPNGALYWRGRYHLFYIFQDPALPEGGHCWGHASSADLLHWTYHPPALVPAPGDPETGIFSGAGFVNRDGVPTLIYHGVRAGTCLATAEDDDLIRWRKHPANPVIPEPRPGGPGWGVYNVFDPHAWVEGNEYRVILGGRVKPHDLYDTAYLFRSTDLVRWEYLRTFYNPNPRLTAEEEDCACPDFFKLGDRHVLVCISHAYGTRYYLGRYQDGTFVPEEHHRMNWPGGPCFAPESLEDARGRRILWIWLLDQRKGEKWMRADLGVMSLPRVLALDGRGRLLIEPPTELAQLRRNPRAHAGRRVSAGAQVTLHGIGGDVLELTLRGRLSADAVCGVKVRVAPDGTEETAIVVDARAGTLAIDTTRGSTSPEVFQYDPLMRGGVPWQDTRVQTAPFTLDPDEPLELRVFLDKSVLEVFANRRQCVTQRIYPAGAASLGTALFCRQGVMEVAAVEAWDLAEVNTCSP